MRIKPIEIVDPDQLYRLSEELRRLADWMKQTEAVELEPGRPVTAPWVRSIIQTRRLRDKFVGDDLFADPAWDMLLDLYASKLEGRVVSVSSLCIAAAVPPTTALRRIRILEDRGLIVRRADERDGRRFLLEISDGAAANIWRVLRAAYPLSGPIL